MYGVHRKIYRPDRRANLFKRTFRLQHAWHTGKGKVHNARPISRGTMTSSLSVDSFNAFPNFFIGSDFFNFHNLFFSLYFHIFNVQHVTEHFPAAGYVSDIDYFVMSAAVFSQPSTHCSMPPCRDARRNRHSAPLQVGFGGVFRLLRRQDGIFLCLSLKREVSVAGPY